MGTAIAAVFLKAHFPVMLFDPSPSAISSAVDRVCGELEKMRPGHSQKTLLTQLVCTENLMEMDGCRIFLESVTEKIRVKQRLYRKIFAFLNQRTLLLTNTSTISIGMLAESLDTPSRYCGFHFFHPVHERSLVEIIRGPQTSGETIQEMVGFAQSIGKTPLVVNDGPGFLVNRLLNPYLASALDLLLEGAEISQIDTAAQQFGMAMGPFRIMDEIGLDVVLHGGWTLFKAFPDRVLPSPILLEMVRLGYLGRKAGQGFMKYDSAISWNTVGKPNSVTEELIRQKRTEANRKTERKSADEVTARLIGGMREEGFRILEDKIVDSPAEVNLAVKLGLGFPKEKDFWTV
jgi:3-hydroxyacyl-CoA dehydrogenase